MSRLLFISLIFTALMTACISDSTEQEGTRLVYGLTLVPSGIDPHIHSSSELGIALRQVYDTLIYRDPDTLEFVPGLATDWIVSDDGLVYTFFLRSDVRFHDDTPFNASAVAANLDRITASETGSQRAASMLGPYDRHEIVDDTTIRIHLSEPYAPLLDSLAQVYLSIASPAALNAYSRNRYQFNQVGTGPYRFVEYLPGDRIVIERNLDYEWGPSFYSKSPDDSGIAETIIFRFYTDEISRRAALENGEAHIMGELLPNDARELATNSRFRVIATPVPGQPAQFLINTALSPTNDPAFRRALLLSADRNGIANTIFQGFSPVAWGPISSTTRYFESDMINQFDFDLIAARELLFNAGYVDTDNNGFFDSAGEDIEITIIVPNWGLIPQIAQVLQDQWRQLGIRTQLEPVPGFNALLDRVNNQTYHLVSFNTLGIDPALLNSYFMTNGSRNWMNYSNQQLDDTLRAAVTAIDPATRRLLYGQIQQFIISEALIIPIREYVNLNAASVQVNGLRFDAYGWFPILNDVTLSTS